MTRWTDRSKTSARQWRTPEDVHHHGAEGLIGPNAVLQLLPLLGARDPGTAGRLMALAGLAGPPSDTAMMPEFAAARLHHAVRQSLGPAAPWMLAEAGRATGDYILAHRIPRAAQRVLRSLPAPLSAPLLKAAIARHAWTFAGSGDFSTRPGLVFKVARNPLVAGESSPAPLCHWHAAVFERLFRTLVDDRLRAHETGCCACGDHACRFELSRPD
jgi:divinyl protochlorophyllide a 8-vinyl-reductase